MSPFLRAAVAPATLLLVTASSTPDSAPRAKGMTGTLTMSIETTGVGTTVVQPTRLSGTIHMVDGKARVDIAESSGPALDFQRGDYFLLLDSAKVTYLRPGSQQFWVQESPFTNPLQQMAARGGGGALAISGVTAELQAVGAGDAVAGAPTMRHRIAVAYTIAAGGQTVPVQVTTELTVAKLPVKFASQGIGTLQGLGLIQSRELSDRINAILTRLAGEGVIVQSVTTTTISVATYNIGSTQRTTITDLKEAEVDDAKLAMPTGYRPGGN